MKIIAACMLTFLILLSFAPQVHSQNRSSVWAVDFVKTKAGHFDDYLKFIKANWATARKEARKQEYIVSYRVLILPSNLEWDVLLITEYANIDKYNAREENFKKVFEKIRQGKGPTLINGLGARDLAEIKFSKALTEPVFNSK